MNVDFEYAPIAVFAFNRPGHLAKLLADLSENSEFDKSPLFIFCDGARNQEESRQVEQVRRIALEFEHPNKTVIESRENQGLANSIVKGVSHLCNLFGSVIVVEDDLALSANFLAYMNSALKKYSNDPRVMQISGHMFPVNLSVETDAVFMPVTTSWGWATWKRAWSSMEENHLAAHQRLKDHRWRHSFDLGGCFPNSRMLSDRLNGRNNSWAIWWYFNVFERDGLVLFPINSFVNNYGFDGTGTHCANKSVGLSDLSVAVVNRLPEVKVDQEAFQCYGRFLKNERGFIKSGFDLIWRTFYSLKLFFI